MITDQGRWDDRDYYDEHFYDIMYDKITEGMKLTVDEMDNLVSAGLFDKEIVPHEEYLEVNDNNQKIAERYFDSSNIKDKTAAADEVLRIYEILTVHQKRLVLQKILKKEDND